MSDNNNYKSPLLKRPDYLVCTCMGVMYSEILTAIENGAKSIQDLSDLLMTSTGCSSCVDEIEQILKESVK